MLDFVRTNSGHPDFIELVRFLDEYLAEKDGIEHAFYAQFNTIDTLKQVIVAYDKGEPVACGAMKELSAEAMEIKRMYTMPACRGRGIAKKILNNLESWAQELSYKKCMLETGIRQTEAIKLYHSCGYSIIPNYGQYAGVENSVCFEKPLAIER